MRVKSHMISNLADVTNMGPPVVAALLCDAPGRILEGSQESSLSFHTCRSARRPVTQTGMHNHMAAARASHVSHGNLAAIHVQCNTGAGVSMASTWCAWTGQDSEVRQATAQKGAVVHLGSPLSAWRTLAYCTSWPLSHTHCGHIQPCQ